MHVHIHCPRLGLDSTLRKTSKQMLTLSLLTTLYALLGPHQVSCSNQAVEDLRETRGSCNMRRAPYQSIEYKKWDRVENVPSETSCVSKCCLLTNCLAFSYRLVNKKCYYVESTGRIKFTENKDFHAWYKLRKGIPYDLCELELNHGALVFVPYTESESNRAAYMRTDKSKEIRCDERGQNWDEAWYIFQAFSDSAQSLTMPTSCLPEYHCGTRNPVWMKGRIPNEERVTVDAAACVTVGDSCCLQRQSMKVRNCGDGIVAYFLSGNYACPAAYCFGEMGSQCGLEETIKTMVYTLENDRATYINTIVNMPEDALLCDGKSSAFQPGWYVFEAPSNAARALTMPTSCVGKYRCGTKYPIWMQGNIPSTSDGVVKRKACVPLTSCCSDTIDIRVKNCGYSTVVYFLEAVPTCPAAYCFGLPGDQCTLRGSPLITVPYQIHKGARGSYVTPGFVAFETSRVDGLLCDKDQWWTSGWHVFASKDLKTSLNMPNQCVPVYRCSTQHPIWMKGNVPTEMEGVVLRQACMSVSGDCCQQTFEIEVKNCGKGTIAYNLPNVPACPSAYCFGIIQAECSIPGETIVHVPNDMSVIPRASYTITRPEDDIESHRCDSYYWTEGWFMFEGEDNTGIAANMPTSCVPEYRCGTKSPVWMNGTIPRQSDGIVDRKACVVIEKDCCSYTIDIQVMKCGPKSVAYWLPPTMECPSSYCVGVVKLGPACVAIENQITIINYGPQVASRLFVAHPTDSEAGARGELSCDKDDWEEGWYVFVAPGHTGEALTMPTSCVPENRCGTRFPVWMEGSIPEADAGVMETKACLSQGTECCSRRIAIKVKNCGNGTVAYWLPALPTCPAAYCFGQVGVWVPPLNTAAWLAPLVVSLVFLLILTTALLMRQQRKRKRQVEQILQRQAKSCKSIKIEQSIKAFDVASYQTLDAARTESCKQETQNDVDDARLSLIRNEHDIIKAWLAESVQMASACDVTYYLSKYKNYCREHVEFGIEADETLIRKAILKVDQERKKCVDDVRRQTVMKDRLRKSLIERDESAIAKNLFQYKTYCKFMAVDTQAREQEINETRQRIIRAEEEFLKEELKTTLRGQIYEDIIDAHSKYEEFCRSHHVRDNVEIDVELQRETQKTIGKFQAVAFGESELRKQLEDAFKEKCIEELQRVLKKINLFYSDNLQLDTVNTQLTDLAYSMIEILECMQLDGDNFVDVHDSIADELHTAYEARNKKEIIKALEKYEHFHMLYHDLVVADDGLVRDTKNLLQEIAAGVRRLQCEHQALKDALIESNFSDNKTDIANNLASYVGFVSEEQATHSECHWLHLDGNLLVESENSIQILELKARLIEAAVERNITGIKETIETINESGRAHCLKLELNTAKELCCSLENIEQAKSALLQFDRNLLQEIRKYKKPPRFVHEVVKATLLILGDPESEVNDWATCQRRSTTIRTHDYPGLLARIREYDINRLRPKVADRAKRLLAGFTQEQVREISHGAGSMYAWVIGMCDHCLMENEELHEDDVLEEAITMREEACLKDGLLRAVKENNYSTIQQRLEDYLEYCKVHSLEIDTQLECDAKSVIKKKMAIKANADKAQTLIEKINEALTGNDFTAMEGLLSDYNQFCESSDTKADKKLITRVNDALKQHRKADAEQHEELSLRRQLQDAMASSKLVQIRTTLDNYQAFIQLHKGSVEEDTEVTNQAVCQISALEEGKDLDKLYNSIKTSAFKAIANRDKSLIEAKVKEYKKFIQLYPKFTLDQNLIDKAQETLQSMLAPTERVQIEHNKYLSTIEKAIAAGNVDDINLHVDEYRKFLAKNKQYASPNQAVLRNVKKNLAVLPLKLPLQEAINNKDMAALHHAILSAETSSVKKHLQCELDTAQMLYDGLLKLDLLKSAAISINSDSLGSMVNCDEPPKALFSVVKATLLLLGEDVIDWESCRRFFTLEDTPGDPELLQRLNGLQISDVRPDVATKALDILGDVSEKDVEACDASAAVLYAWISELSRKTLIRI